MTTKLTTFEEETKEKIKKMLNDPICGLKESSDTNKIRSGILAEIENCFFQQREMMRKDLDEDMALLLGTFANTPIPERKTGWDWIIRARLIVRSLLSNKETLKD